MRERHQAVCFTHFPYAIDETGEDQDVTNLENEIWLYGAHQHVASLHADEIQPIQPAQDGDFGVHDGRTTRNDCTYG